jgi:hypothetical protein
MAPLRASITACMLLAVSGCSDLGPGPSTSIPFHFTDNDRREALFLAMEIKGELSPSPASINEMLISINSIRYVYSESVRIDPMIRERLAARYQPPWVPGELIIKFDSLTFRDVWNNKYTGWGRIPIGLLPTLVGGSAADRLITVAFPDNYNPERVAEIYAANLPGLQEASPQWRGLLRGQEWPVRAWLMAGEMCYLFRRFSLDDFDDRPELYFRYLGGKPSFVGVE